VDSQQQSNANKDFSSLEMAPPLSPGRGCQMVYFHTKSTNFPEWEILLYFMANWNILRPIAIMYGILV
jgi:hypothetical protein